MKYKLKSGLASYEGETMGEKVYIFPINKKGVETALKEALEELADAKREAESLALFLWEKHYKDESPNFCLCDSVAGVISQIDNMTTGLSKTK